MTFPAIPFWRVWSGMVLLGVVWAWASQGFPAEAPSSAAAEKAKALGSPYANDLGPEELSQSLLSRYPTEAREGYTTLRQKCAKCHAASRPLNSEFTAPDVWQRYVKRMMAKPGCDIPSSEGKRIWQFLVHDSKTRKTGAAQSAWEAHRKTLLERFKSQYPARYKELYEGKR